MRRAPGAGGLLRAFTAFLPPLPTPPCQAPPSPGKPPGPDGGTGCQLSAGDPSPKLEDPASPLRPGAGGERGGGGEPGGG